MKNAKIKVLSTSILTIALCLCLMIGSTYAMFTSDSSVTVTVTSATVAIDAVVSNPLLSSSLGFNLPETTAVVKDNVLTVSNMVPGDTVTFTIYVMNSSNVKTLYRTCLKAENDDGLFAGLDFKINKVAYTGNEIASDWAELAPAATDGAVLDTIEISITLPEEAGNEFQHKTCSISYVVQAVQANADTSTIVFD